MAPRRHRLASALLALAVLALGIVVPATPAAAGPVQPRTDCSVGQWITDFGTCVDGLTDALAARVQCLTAPTPESPDANLGGYFASAPDQASRSRVIGMYSNYAYAGYSYTTYDIGCVSTVMHPDYKFENTVANGEFMIATGVVGASNALRERAWDPGMLWQWSDPLVENATHAIYEKVFTVFGAVTLAIVGLYLLWRSRQAHMSAAMTTAGWAVLVMVIVTALASWPVFSAHLADRSLVSALQVVHNAVGPPAEDRPAADCPGNPDACVDHRAPAVRASDTAVETIIYRNWLRGLLGSADSLTAQKYGHALYDAKSITWSQLAEYENPDTRQQLLDRKSQEWMKVAEQIKAEDPEAYEHLRGVRGMSRIGAGLIALVSALLFALFDLTSSVLILLGYVVFRWAVIAAPLLGTVGLLRPASAGFRRLMNAVVAALFNIVIFGSGAAIYLFAVYEIMHAPSLPEWLQVVLVGLCGIVGWMLLRPYRRVTQLGGGVTAAAALAASRQSTQVRPEPAVASPQPDTHRPVRVEQRPDPVGRPTVDAPGAVAFGSPPEVELWPPQFAAPDTVDAYRPPRSTISASPAPARDTPRPTAPRTRSEARQEA